MSERITWYDLFKLSELSLGATENGIGRFTRRDKTAILVELERRADSAEFYTTEFNPLGGASRGIGRCVCAAGPGTNPACQIHP